MRQIKLKAIKRINGLHFTPDGRKLLAVGGAEVRMQDEAVWIDVGEMKETLRIPLHANCAAVSADAKRIAVGNSRPFWERDSAVPPVAVFDATDPTWHEDDSRWQTVIASPPTAMEIYALAFDSIGKKLAVSYSAADRRGYHTTFRLAVHPLGRGKPVQVPSEPDEFATEIAFTRNGRSIATNGGPESSLVFAERSAGTLAHRRTSGASPRIETRHLVYSPDSATLAVVRGRTVTLLPRPTSKEPQRTLAHPKQANAVAFTPDGRRVLSTCHDGLLRIWDTATGQLVTSYDWGIGQTTAVAVSPDGLTAAVAGQKGQIAVFDLG
jgi:WD40 repeat protein